MSKQEKNIHGESIETALGIIRQSVYLRVAAVQHAEAVETSRSSLSVDPEKRAKQRGYLWSQALKALHNYGVTLEVASVSGSDMVPYRRFVLVWTETAAARKVLEVLSRVRPHVMEVISSRYFAGDDAIGSVGDELLQALIDYDLPRIARLAQEHPTIRDGLSTYLGFDEDDFYHMGDANCADWGDLDEAEQYFGRFDPNRCNAA